VIAQKIVIRIMVAKDPSIGQALEELVKESFPEGEIRSRSPEDCLGLLREKLQRLDTVENELVRLRAQVSDLVVENAHLTRNDVNLQGELERLRSSTEPGLLQLKQLIIEPAVNREFMRLASLAKSSSMEAHHAKEELRGLHFASSDPKGPRSLLSQIKGLENKVRSLSAESMESRASSLETSLKLSESKVQDLQKKVYSLEERSRVLLQDKDVLEKELLSYRHPRHASKPGGAKRGRSGRGR
jgi:predicted RNase H-like nuclease (RuvC/YqgF family)